MPLQLPNFDDRTYNDLVEEAIALIPTYAPDWTNYNPSDPGITLIELFAYLSEMLLYRQNRITDDNIVSFLKLLNGPTWKRSGTTPDAVQQDIKETILKLRHRERAVSCEDFEELALRAGLAANPPLQRVARVRCVPRRNLFIDSYTERAGHISVVIVPKEKYKSELNSVLNEVRDYLESRRLLTTFLHVVEPQYLPISIKTELVPLPDVTKETVERTARNALKNFLAPLNADDHPNWPFGRSVFVSEIYELLDRLSGVDYVYSVDVDLSTPVSTRRIEAQGSLVGIELKPHELVKELTDSEVTVKTLLPEEAKRKSSNVL